MLFSRLPHALSVSGVSPQERTYIPEDQRYTNKNSQAAFCYSETIPAPTGKDDAQQKSVSRLPPAHTALFYGTQGFHLSWDSSFSHPVCRKTRVGQEILFPP